MPIIDQFNDPAFGTLYRQVSRMPALEGFIKEASVDAADARSLPDSAFAWPDERKYPIHTPEHTALSYAYAKVANELPVYVMDSIKTALSVYQIPESTFEEREVKVASSVTGQYVLPEFNYLPVNNPEQVKTAQHQLLEEIHKLDVERRAVAASNLVKQADVHKVELSPEVMKLAGLVVSNTKVAADWLYARADQLKPEQSNYKAAYVTLADSLVAKNKEHGNRNDLMKVANAVAVLDEKTGLDKHYDRKLPDALRTVFNTTKVAAASVDLGGTYVPVSKLTSLPPSFWKDLGGEELSHEIAPGGKVDPAKLVEVVETLPLDLKTVLKAQVR